MKIENDPIGMLLECFEELYKDVKVNIRYDTTIRRRFKLFGCWGYTDFNNEIPKVRVSAMLPLLHVTEILAHELSHVVAGLKAGHGKEWEKVFDNIHEMYVNKNIEMEQKDNI